MLRPLGRQASGSNRRQGKQRANMKKMRSLLTLVLVGIFVNALWPTASKAWQGQLTSWDSVRFNATTEDDFVYRFGIPDYVEWQMPWAEFSKNRATVGSVRDYSLKYVNYRDSLLFLSGPLGRASSGWAEVSSGKIVALGWEYAVNYREPAYSTWMADTTFTMGTNQKLMVGTKNLRQGKLFVTCPMQNQDLKCSGDITVLFSPMDTKPR